MAFNVNELILDKVRSLTAHSINDEDYGKILFRLTSLEDPSLSCTAEGEEIVDAIGAVITTLYRAKKATFSASNSLISLDLAAAQYGTKKEVASSDNKIKVPTYEIITIPTQEDGVTPATTVALKNKAVEDILYIYHIEGGEIATSYAADKNASSDKFAFGTEPENDCKTITLPTGLKGKIYVEYTYEADGDEEKKNGANRIVNKTSNFPEACSMKIYAYFRDKCNENLVYSGVIVSPKAKLNPESLELALTSTGKHPFEFQMMRDYCDDEAELFSIIIAE